MVTIINPPQQKMLPGVALLDKDHDDGGWLEDPEWSDEFEPALWIIFHTHDIHMDSTLTPDQSRGTENLGVLSARFGRWTIYLNWQTKWAQKIPPHHLLVEYNGSPVGILSPFLMVRTCWQCGRGSPIRKDGRYDQEGYFAFMPPAQRLLHPDWPLKVPAVLPAHPCPACGNYDWWGSSNLIGPHQATREDFQRDAAETAAKLTETDSLAQDMAVVHSREGEGQRYVKTAV